MAQKRCKAEQIMARLRQIEVAIAIGKSIPEAWRKACGGIEARSRAESMT